ncbi:Uma2 family endonuclease [Hansschlegelia zhihuaiae]|uniref:Uma2 family endonuclease n=1 Tax=Hansschlegelia zhihuaiae TaxID=405005 RepID=A0A4Q0MQS0_9HYPH|nr:Uma2 family endonuclease [Hansschlegelia zhihuaiae]RXF75486.1 Uma2 family endonuclease [Hansschlegelia zhihuaiae]
MGVAERMVQPGTFDVDAFMAFLESRPEKEKWQLVDGVAQRIMTPPLLTHQRIGVNLLMALNQALGAKRSDLLAYYEAGVRLPDRRDFQPEPDILVLPAIPPTGHWTENFLLVAEILSPSNDREKIDRKVELYAEGPDNLHILVVSQDAVKVVHRARSAGWRPDELGEEDRLLLPEFGFDVAVLDLYRGTKLAGPGPAGG